MIRSLYQFVLWMHPPAFRRRFRDEMLSIFDEGEAGQSGFALLLDGFISLTRQWLIRTDSWKILIAISGAFIQVFWGFGYKTGGHESWAKDHQALTPYMQELMIITLALICSLFMLITALALWTMRFQHRRMCLAELVSIRHRARLQARG